MASYKSGELVCALNGKVVLKTDRITGDLPWRKVPLGSGLSIGGPEGARFTWRGKVEGIAMFARALSAEEAANDFAAYSRSIARRKTIPRIALRAKLVAKSKVPSPADIAPYVDALVVNEYEVVKVLAGAYAGKNIRVAQWGLMNSRPTRLTRAPVGTVVQLSVELFSDHPQLEAEVTRSTLEENFDLDRYVDVTIRPAGKPRLANIVLRPGETWAPLGIDVPFKAERLDQYSSPIDVKLKWTVAGRGSINSATAYGAGRSFPEARGAGAGTIKDGVLVGTRAGTVTVTAAGIANPEVRRSTIVGLGPYPGVHPCGGLPLTLGRGFKGDIDRMRIYRRVLSPKEIAAHAAGKGLDDKDAGLVGDWTFDRAEGGAYPNAVGEGLAAKINGKVTPGRQQDARYVSLDGKGHFQVANDRRLNISRNLTMEAWIRPRGGGGLFTRQRVWSWGFSLILKGRTLILDGLRRSWSAMEVGHDFSLDKWTHVVAILGEGGLWQLHVNGQFVKEYKPKPMIITESAGG